MTRLDGADAAAVRAAAERLAAGELVAFPTETVYGLGARADDDTAVAKIFAAKGRPSEHPLIVHVARPEDAPAFAAHWPDRAQRLVAAFWPGPLTVIVPRRAGLAAAAAGGQDSIGLRCPAHPVARALLSATVTLGVPGLAAPSANRFGRVSPTTAAHVVTEFGPDMWVVDGGACAEGIESAIVDCSRDRAVLLRPGTLSRARLEAALGERLAAPDAAAPRASGTLEAHYAPRARVRLMDGASLRAAVRLLEEAAGAAPVAAVYSRTVDPRKVHMPCRRMPEDPALAAKELFAVLRELDDSGVPLIWIEHPPEHPDWDGVRDRLRRASAAEPTSTSEAT